MFLWAPVAWRCLCPARWLATDNQGIPSTPCGQMFDSRVLLLVLAAGCFVWSCTGQSNIAADFAALTQSLLGQSLPLPSAVVGGVAISSRSSFPFVHVSGRVAAAAGYYPSCSEADGCSSPARMVVLAHTGFATYANDYAYLKTLMRNTLL
ncbi:hypothetical protein QOT17_007032 [Balamuthia mandrillaris]